jgi:hypothetical protein
MTVGNHFAEVEIHYYQAFPAPADFSVPACNLPEMFNERRPKDTFGASGLSLRDLRISPTNFIPDPSCMMVRDAPRRAQRPQTHGVDSRIRIVHSRSCGTWSHRSGSMMMNFFNTKLMETQPPEQPIGRRSNVNERNHL